MNDTPQHTWDWYLAKRAGKPVVGVVDDPQPGFFREPRKKYYGARRTFRPVAYYPDPETGELRCRVGDEEWTEAAARSLWNRIWKWDVAEKDYRKVAQDGEPWPDEHELVPMGDNMPPEEAEELALWPENELIDRIEDLGREALKRTDGEPVKDQDECDRVANLCDRLMQLWNEAERRRTEERKPFDDQLKAIQTKWLPILDRAESYKNLKHKIVSPWLIQERKRLQEEAKAAAAAGEPVSEPRRPRAGTRGRATSLRKQKRAEITDYAICLDFFKDSEDIRSCVQMLANRAVRSGVPVPGAEVIEEEKAV